MRSLLIRKSGIQNRLIVSYFLLIVMIIGLLGVAFYQISASIIERQVGKSRLNVLEQISKNINVIIDEITSVSNIYYFNEDLVRIIRTPIPKDPYVRITDANKMMEIFSHYTYSFDNLKYYSVLYGFNGRAYTSWINDVYNFNSILQQRWYNEVLKKDGKITWISTFNDKAGYRSDKYVFSAARLLKSYYSDKSLGILLLNVDEEVLFNTYKDALKAGSSIYIIDHKGNVISHSYRTRLGVNLSRQRYIKKLFTSTNGGNYIVNKKGQPILLSFYPIPKVNWFIIEEVPLRTVLAPMNKMKYFTFLFLTFGMLLGLIFSYGIARRISLPIRALHHSMKEVEKGNFKRVNYQDGRDEIGELGKGFNQMIDRIDQLMKDVKKEAHLKRQAELEFLQAQINPHFLYNTLTSIRSMVALGKDEKAEGMLVALARLLRKIFTNHDEFTTIGEELAVLGEYLLIQASRYPEKFDVIQEISDDVRDCQIPKLILQPLVENAIFHGIEPKKDRGRITIRGWSEGRDLRLEVSDDGVGMTAEQLQTLWDKNNNMEKQLNRVGVMNVNDRLVLNYGPKYGLKIESTPGGGTTVSLCIPLVQSRAQAAKTGEAS